MNDAILEYCFEPSDLGPAYFEFDFSGHGGTRPELAKPLVSPPKPDKPLPVFDAPRSKIVSNVEPPPTVTAASKLPVGDSETVEAPSPKAVPAQPDGVSAEHRHSNTRLRKYLSVHALGQFVFCRRSAILAAENGDDSDDRPMPRLTYLPNFDLERIEEALRARLSQMGLAMICCVIGFCLMVTVILNRNLALFCLSLMAFIGCSMWCLQQAIYVAQLASRRRAAMRAEVCEPIPEVIAIQVANWWSLLKSGFEPVNYDRPFRHPEFPLEGCPWRVLERGSQRVPVIRSGAKKLGDTKGTLYPKHQIRLVAYALLLESIGHVQVPYGIVIPADSPRGYAMPITDAMRAEAVAKLRGFTSVLDDSQRHQIHPAVPKQRKRCQQCPHGKPESISLREIDTVHKTGKNVVVLVSPKSQTFHCECGDRFGSVPPHRTIIERKLLASVQ